MNLPDGYAKMLPNFLEVARTQTVNKLLPNFESVVVKVSLFI